MITEEKQIRVGDFWLCEIFGILETVEVKDIQGQYIYSRCKPYGYKWQSAGDFMASAKQKIVWWDQPKPTRKWYQFWK